MLNNRDTLGNSKRNSKRKVTHCIQGIFDKINNWILMRSHGRQEVMKVLKGKGSEPRILYEANPQKLKILRYFVWSVAF